MFFLTPRHVKYGREFTKDAKKLLAYKRDLLSEGTIADFEAGIGKLEGAVKARDKDGIEAAAQALDAQCGAFVKPQADAGWRENCEVFLVAIVVALGVRTYFLQPFTIPTGSMQPTLNGILAYPTKEERPNILTRIVQFALWGRTWVEVVSKTDDVIMDVRETTSLGVLSRSEIIGQKNRYVVDCPIGALRRELMTPKMEFKAGEVIARGYYETGDHVFVDKMSYHFRTPKAGEVFVFNTQNVPTRENVNTGMNGPSQYYIKRLVGTPGDTLRIAEPELFRNGERAAGLGFERVMSVKDGYRGYANGWQFGSFKYLLKPDESLTLPPKEYFALGDNSFSSSDSRDWGTVPEANIMGRGVLVYWPFTRHFGVIR